MPSLAHGFLVITLLVVILLPTGVLLRSTGIARPWLLAGFIVGILIGPTLAGRVTPDIYERFFIGGIDQRLAIEDLRRIQAADVLALTSVGASPVALEELKTEHAKVMSETFAQHEQVKIEFQAPTTTSTLFLACLLIGAISPRFATLRMTGPSLFSLLWLTVLAAGPIAILASYGLKATTTQAVCVGLTFALVGVTGGVPRLPVDNTGPYSFHVVRTTAILGWLTVFLIVMFTLLITSHMENTVHPNHWKALYGVFIGLFACAILRRLVPRLSQATFVCFIGGLIVAMGVQQIDLIHSRMIAPLLLGVIIGGDGRWFAGATALRLLGVSWRESWIRSIPLTDAGGVATAIAFVFWSTGLISERFLLMALVGAIACDLMYRARYHLVMSVVSEEEQTD